MQTYFYEVIGEDTEDDLTTVSVVNSADDELSQFSVRGIFRLDTQLGVAALEDAILTRLIQEGDADENDELEQMGPLEESGEFDESDDDDSDDDDDADEWDDDEGDEW